MFLLARYDLTIYSYLQDVEELYANNQRGK